MGMMRSRYIPHCCFVYLTEELKYLTKITKCDEESIRNHMESGEIFEDEMHPYEISQRGDDVYLYECEPIKNERYKELVQKYGKLKEYINEEKPIDVFFGIGEGRIYVEEGKFNTKEEGGSHIYDENGYGIENPKYRFTKLEKTEELFRKVRLG
jgi:hypothetical protein